MGETENIKIDLRQLSDQDFLALGKNALAYVRPVTIDGKDLFAIHAADGTPLIVLDDYENALAMVVQEDLVPATLH